MAYGRYSLVLAGAKPRICKIGFVVYKLVTSLSETMNVQLHNFKRASFLTSASFPTTLPASDLTS